jgi:hypothetical protein
MDPALCSVLDVVATSVGLLPERVGDYADDMPPSVNRRYWRSFLYLVPAAVIIVLLADAANLGLGWIYLAGAVVMVASALHTTRPRKSEREEYEEFARKRGVPYPPPGKGWPHR